MLRMENTTMKKAGRAVNEFLTAKSRNVLRSRVSLKQTINIDT